MSSKFKTVREEYALPDTQEGIVNLVQSALSAGAVEKLVVELGKPVFVYRMVEVGPYDEPEVELDAAIRASGYIEYYNPNEASPYEILADMITTIKQQGLEPFAFVTGPDGGMLDNWLGTVERGMPTVDVSRQVLGVPLHRIPSFPEESLLLCGTDKDIPQAVDVTHYVKTTIEEIDHEAVVETVAGSGSYPKRERAADGELENYPRRGLVPGWATPPIL